MLGRGLESLIPKKNTQNSPQPGDDLGKGSDESSRRTDLSRLPASREDLDSRSDDSDVVGNQARRSSETSASMIPRSKKIGRSGSESIFQIEINKIKPNPHQPRKDFDEALLKDLAASIREFGIIQPLVVSKVEEDTDFGTDVHYQLIAGERRLRAVQMLGWERVPAIVKQVNSHKEHLELAVVENLQRENLNPIETARAYAKLQDEFNLTQREIGSRLGKSRETISNTMRLLSLPTEIQDALMKNQINESQARLILTIENPKEQQAVFHELLKNHLSVRELRSRVRTVQNKEQKPASSERGVDPELKILQEELSKALGAKVTIQKNDAGGKIIIDFFSPEEIGGIIKKIVSQAEENPLL